MTGNPETSRPGATACEYGIDWEREQRDEAIQLVDASAKPKTKDNGEKPRASQSNSGPASSFRTETSEAQPSAAQATSQGSQPSLLADSCTIESSIDELALDFKVRGQSIRKGSKPPRRS